MLFEGRYKTQDYFRYFLHLFSVPSFIFSKKKTRLILAYLQRIGKIIHYLYSKGGFTYGHSIQYMKSTCFISNEKQVLTTNTNLS